MPRYIMLYRFTDQGRKNIKGTVRRAEAVRKEIEVRGFKLLARYWTLGHYDLVTIVEAPSEEAMVAANFNVMEAGNVIPEALRAFSDEELLAVGAAL
jgi:uncharacterized protein with GYD domain